MNVRKSLIVAGAVAGMGIAGLGTAGAVSAMSGQTDGQDGLVTKIAQKFNLNEADVKAVFDANRTEHQAAMKQKIETQLSADVSSGKITADQKTKILAKIDALEAARESDRTDMKDKTDAERKALMDQKRADLQQWLKDNGLDSTYERYLMGGMGGKGGGHMMK